jgi:hypothetical protein
MELPLKRLALFSSGVGFFEHSGTLNDSGTVDLVFDAGAVNDALKSLAVSDPASEFPSVSYASASALKETLRSLKVDLSGKTGLRSILNSLKGAEIEVSAPAKFSGRIAGVEKRSTGLTRGGKAVKELYLLLFVGAELKAVAVKDISAFSFKDEAVAADLNRALDILSAERNDKNRNLAVSLPGAGERNVSLSYVVPVPVWKVSYRLALGTEKPFIQGWAIVDNDSDTDWNNVELSLVTGKPVSFIQNLSEPYLTSRPELPLAIAGIAKAKTYESGEEQGTIRDDISQNFSTYDFSTRRSTVREDINQNFSDSGPSSQAYLDMLNSSDEPDFSTRRSTVRVDLTGGLNDYKNDFPPGGWKTTKAKPAGEQFAFTLKDGVSIERRKSAMLPLIEAEMRAEKLLVLSGKDAQGETVNPSVGVELVNNTGMKLPAGPITVYDGGSYAGDALVEFLPENEKRIISYGEDLSIRGSVNYSGTDTVTAAALSKGVLTVSRIDRHEFVYTVRNASSSSRKLIIEHPITRDANLVEPAKYEEKTPDLYRFAVELPANREIEFTVIEEEPGSEDIVIGRLESDVLVKYSADKRLSDDARAVLKKAVDFMKKIDDAEKSARKFEEKRDGIIDKQDRIRQNLEAAGSQTAQGQRYLSRLVAMDDEIDALTKSMDEANEKAEALKKEFEEVIGVPLGGYQLEER